MATAVEVAQWLVDHIKSEETEYQEVVVQLLAERFPDWDHVNNDGNPAVHPKVLYQFKKLHAGSIEWDRSGRTWSVR